jgi:hypothetical protein
VKFLGLKEDIPQPAKKLTVKKNEYFGTCLTFKPYRIMANDFKPNIGKPVPKTDAEAWIAKFDKERKKDTKSVFFGRDSILEVLAQDPSAGISFFFARKFDDDLKKDVDTLVMVATAEDGTLLWDSTAAKTLNATGGYQTYDQGRICPPYCPK